MPRFVRTEAIVLSRRDLGESDRIIQFLSRERGKFSAVAPAARKSRRRFGGCLELFCYTRLRVVDKGPNRLQRLEEAVLIDGHDKIKTDLVAIGHAGYVSELIAAFLGEEDEAESSFDLLSATLHCLDQGPLSTVSLRLLELSVLSLAGFAPHLGSCLACGTESLAGEGMWAYDHSRGGILCTSCASGHENQNIPVEVQCFFRSLRQQGSEGTSVDPQCMHLARSLLAKIIDSYLGKPLKSREFLRKLAGV